MGNFVQKEPISRRIGASSTILNDSVEQANRRLALLDYFTFEKITKDLELLREKQTISRSAINPSANRLNGNCEYHIYRPNRGGIEYKTTSLHENLNSPTASNSFEKKLLNIFNNNIYYSNEIVFEQITKSLSQDETTSAVFVRSLVMAFIIHCLRPRFELNLFRKRVKILNLFIFQNEDYETQALFAIQDFGREIMPQYIVLVPMFYDLFYEERIISEPVFISILDANELVNMLRNTRNYSQACRLYEHLKKLQSSPQNLKQRNPGGNIYQNQNNAYYSDFIFDNDPTNPIKPMKPNEMVPKQEELQKNENISKILNEKEPECPICIEPFNELKRKKVHLMSTKCGHIICKPCSDTMFRMSTRRRKSIDCPICRKSVESTEIHLIFI